MNCLASTHREPTPAEIRDRCEGVVELRRQERLEQAEQSRRGRVRRSGGLALWLAEFREWKRQGRSGELSPSFLAESHRPGEEED
jgi:hypothetical protein